MFPPPVVIDKIECCVHLYSSPCLLSAKTTAVVHVSGNSSISNLSILWTNLSLLTCWLINSISCYIIFLKTSKWSMYFINTKISRFRIYYIILHTMYKNLMRVCFRGDIAIWESLIVEPYSKHLSILLGHP